MPPENGAVRKTEGAPLHLQRRALVTDYRSLAAQITIAAHFIPDMLCCICCIEPGTTSRIRSGLMPGIIL